MHSSTRLRAVVGRRVEGAHRPDVERPQLLDDALVLTMERDSSLAISASSGSRPSERRSEAIARVHVAAQAPERARRPVEIAQRVEHRALDAPPREGVERHAERRLVAAGGIDQADHADADEIGDLHLRGQPLREALRERLDERHVLQHEAVAPLVRSSTGSVFILGIGVPFGSVLVGGVRGLRRGFPPSEVFL
jgi:hypothetical protein